MDPTSLKLRRAGANKDSFISILFKQETLSQEYFPEFMASEFK